MGLIYWTLCIGLLAQRDQVPKVPYIYSMQFSNRDVLEVSQFRRYAKKIHLKVGETTPGPDIAYIKQDEPSLQRAFDSYRDEFGIDMRVKDAQGVIVLPFKMCSITPPKAVPAAEFFASEFDNRSLMWRAFDKGGFKPLICGAGKRIESIAYYVRPFIAENLKITDAVFMSLKLSTPDGDTEVDLFYDGE